VLHEAQRLVPHLQPEVRLVAHREEPRIAVADHDRHLFPHVRQRVLHLRPEPLAERDFVHPAQPDRGGAGDVGGPYPRVPVDEVREPEDVVRRRAAVEQRRGIEADKERGGGLVHEDLVDVEDGPGNTSLTSQRSTSSSDAVPGNAKAVSRVKTRLQVSSDGSTTKSSQA
jgi:hypothetical protein